MKDYRPLPTIIKDNIPYTIGFVVFNDDTISLSITPCIGILYATSSGIDEIVFNYDVKAEWIIKRCRTKDIDKFILETTKDFKPLDIEKIKMLAIKRCIAKNNKNYIEADAIRKKVSEFNITINDI